MKSVVIGSGLAGLTAAATLAQKGWEVDVFEQFERTGGVTAPYEQDGFRWDLGQLMVEGLGAGEPIGRVLAALNIPVEELPPFTPGQPGAPGTLRIRREDRGYVFPDFELRKPVQPGGLLWRIQRLKELFPDDAPGLDRYWSDFCRLIRLLTCARRMETEAGPNRLLWTARLYLSLLPLLTRKDWSARRLMDSYFKSEQLKCVFTSILADFFTPPSQFLGLGVFALNQEVAYDCRLPARVAGGGEQVYQYSIIGGIGRLVEALESRIRQSGGRIHPGRLVTQVVVEGGRATGVVDSAGAFTPAEAVIASGGVRELYFNLVGEQHLTPAFAEQVRSVPLMDSIFMLHLGIDFDPSPHLHGVTTYFYGTYDVEGGVETGRQGIYHEGRDGFVVHLPSLHTPGMAPAGCHAMTIYTIAPDRLSKGEWADHKEEHIDRLLGYAEQRIPGLRQHIRSLAVITPDDWRARTHTAHHAFGGLAPVMGAWKPPHRTPIAGLWFVGAQSESAGGVNNVIPAAYRIALAAAA